MAQSRASTAVDCTLCGKTISRKADLPRHLKTHATNKEELMHACPYVGCRYRALQRSNLLTHLNVHSGKRPNKCPADGCEFSTSDPGTLTRHRKERHGYEPKGNSSGSHASSNPRRAARQRRRNTPYTPSSSRSGSTRSLSLDPPSPPLSVSLVDDRVEEGRKDVFAVYSTQLATKRAQVNDTHLSQNPGSKNAPLNSGSSTASGAPAAERPQLPMPEQGNLYPVDVAVQPVSEATVSDEVSNNFPGQLNDWQSAASAVPVPTTHSLYTVDDAHIPTLTFHPPYALDNAPSPTPSLLPFYAVDVESTPTPALLPLYTVDNAPISTPAFLPPYAAEDAPVPQSVSRSLYKSFVDSTPCEYYGYTTEAVSLDAQWSQPDSFATPDMGVYPQDVNQGCFYTIHAGTNSFTMRGLYVN